jgi:hypothetical protein
MSRNWIIALIAIALVGLLCLACVCLVSVTAWIYSTQGGVELPALATGEIGTPVVVRPADITPEPSPTPVEELDPPPTATASGGTPALSPSHTPTPSSAGVGPADNLERLKAVEIPEADLYELANRLEGKEVAEATLQPPAAPAQVGERRQFWISDSDSNENFQVDATLQHVTEHAYFWIEDGVDYSDRELADMARAFEEQIYPTNREFFGEEWSPGIDGDPHIYILYARGLGGSVAGYFSSVDSYNPEAVEYSNGHEMFVFSADHTSFSEEYSEGVLAHEFQHMIHWNLDRNEEIWLNEGFSDLAMFLNGYGIGGHDFVFSLDPDLQLNDWPTEPEQRTAHYGASFLFTAYFLDRFGDEATQAVVANPGNGLDSIDEALDEMGITDPLTGNPIDVDQLVAEWATTNYLQDPSVADGRYAYEDYRSAPQVSETESIQDCTTSMQTRDVHQYAADYISIRCDEPADLHFEGSIQVGLVPVQPHSGDYAFWSNKGSSSDVTLTREFDFTSLSGPISLSYWTWFDLEEDFDYLYLEASTDGQNWQILSTPSGTDEDPTGASYGWAYNGKSGRGAEAEWIEERIDLSDFAGQKVQIRFEYITDMAVNGEGFLLDDVSIPEIGYTANFEADDGGWESAGWARILNTLPQTFRLALISKGAETTVQHFELPADNALDIPLDFDGDVREVVLVVVGTTRYTRQPAAYRFSFEP